MTHNKPTKKNQISCPSNNKKKEKGPVILQKNENTKETERIEKQKIESKLRKVSKGEKQIKKIQNKKIL